MRYLVLYCSLVVFQHISFAQETPKAGFNHMFIVLRSEDLTAIRKSEFIKNKLAGFESRTTTARNETWTGTYLYALDNYIELFDTTGMRNLPVGTLGMGFSVDRMKDLDLLKTDLSKKYTLDTFTQSRYYDSTKVTWFHSLFINDSVFDAQSSFGVWVMAYDSAYFNYNKLSYKNDLLTAKDYLQKFDKERNGKIIKRFTGAVLNLTKYEKDFFSKYLLNIGFSRSGTSGFISKDNFTFSLNDRAVSTDPTLSALLFETEFSKKEELVEISNNINVAWKGKNGGIIFK